MKKNYIIFVAVLLALVGGYFIFAKQGGQNNQTNNPAPSVCEVKEITFYYLDGCPWCEKVKSEGTIQKIEALGIKVKSINAAIGPIRDKFGGTPTFVIGGKVYEGYRTFDELKALLNCPESAPTTTQENILTTPPAQEASINYNDSFSGERGENVALVNKEVLLEASTFDDGRAHFYNVEISNEKIIYFFVVKDKNGVYRAAANACAVCFKTYKGFRQEGNEIVCNNCGNRYPIEKVATEKGGCNPGPINPNLSLKDGKIIINQTDIEKVADLF